MHDIAREALAQFMTDRCQILDATRAAGVLNEGDYSVTLPETEIYTGRCLVQTAASSRDAIEGEAEGRIEELTLKLPPDAPEAPTGATVRILASADAELVGAEFEVIRSEVRTRRGTRGVGIRRGRALGSTGGPVV